MPYQENDIELTIILGTFLVLFFVAAIIFLVTIFNKKKQIHEQEKELIKASFDQAILQSQIEIQAQTFDLISQEIHDNVGQVLSLAKVQLNIVDQNNQADKELLLAAKDNISRAMNDLRDIAKSLNSDRLQEQGLKVAIEQTVARLTANQIVEGTIVVAGTERRMGVQKEMVLFRIVQECLQNIIKHAAAKKIVVQLNYLDEEIEIQIKDDGRGFDVAGQMEAKEGLGLRNIVKRTEVLGGTALVESIIELGTSIKLTIPYE